MKSRFSFLFFAIFVFSNNSLLGQNKKVDSLKTILNSSVHDTVKVFALHQLYLLTDSLHYAQEELLLSQKTNYQTGIALANLHIGRWYYFAGKEDLALNFLITSVKLAEKTNDKKILVSAYRYIGFIYRPHEPYKALEYYQKTLKISEEIGDELASSYAYSAIGNIYEGIYDTGNVNTKKALDNYLKSLAIRERKGSPSEVASSLNETSRMYDALGDYQKALELRMRGLDIAKKNGDHENVVYICNLLGNDYANRFHDYKNGLKYQLKAFEAGKNIKNNFLLLYDVSKAIAVCYKELGEIRKSNDFFLLSAMFNDSVRANAKKYDYNLSDIKQGLEKELEKQKLLVKDAEISKGQAEAKNLTFLRNSFFVGFCFLLIFVIFVFNAYRQKRKINEELGKRNIEIESAYKSLALSEGNFKQITESINEVFYLYNIVEKKYEYINPICETMLGLPPQYFYDGKSMKVIVHEEDKQIVIDANVKIDSGIPYEIEYRIIVNGQEKWIAEKSSPVFDGNRKLIRNSGVCADITRRKIAEEILRKKNKDIADSIEYGSKIQTAVLVPKEKISVKLHDFFIFFQPKEIVSGDFYFYTETNNGVLIAACDCTGHGVSAGFMSMIGNAFLHEIVTANGITTPSEILNQLRKMIIDSLNQKVSSTEANDGIDIALLNIDLQNYSAEYAGAFNSLFFVRQGELKEIKADLFPVGISFAENQAAFRNHKLDLQKGDSIYIGTDGYADQFGGPDGKKFMKKPLQEILLSIQDKNMPAQGKILEEKFLNWKGKLNQVDDVLVIGIRI